MKKTLVLTAAFVGAAFTANAAIFTDVWSNWSTTYQSIEAYNEGNGTLRSNATSNGGTVLNIANGNIFPEAMPGGTPGFQGEAFTPEGLYNSTALPTFTFVNTSTLEGVTSLQLRIVYGPRDNSSALATLTSGSITSSIAGVPLEHADAERFGSRSITYTWNFDEAVNLNGFQIEFTAVQQRTGYESFALTAVPEPSTYALLAGAFGLAAVVVARRRRA